MKHIIQISLGPVQGFIAASRKTRDLKAGSDLLAEMAKAAVEALSGSGTTLIFPADESGQAANVILAEIDQDPAEAARAVEQRVRAFMREKWLQAAPKDLGQIAIDKGAAQAEAFPEVFVAWAPMNGDYQQARKACGRAMAARKALRDFAQPQSDPGSPKSPLAPWLDTVVPLGEGFRVKNGIGPRLGHLKDRETLDAVSLVKRLAKLERDDRFPSTRTIAASGFLAALDEDKRKEIEDKLADLETDCDIGDLAFNDLDGIEDKDKKEQARELQAELMRHAKEQNAAKPRPYFAVLHADGDWMGKFLDAVGQDLENHRLFSRILSKEFSEKAAGVVRERRGWCVYAGGDDVLALLPVETAIECAKEIRGLFAEAMKAVKEQVADAPTLSVGLAIVHHGESLQEAVAFSAQLEHLAKNQPKKNSLAIGARARSGGDAVLVIPWDAKRDGSSEGQKGQGKSICLLDTFKEIQEAMGKSKAIPRGFPYEIRELVKEMEGLAGSENPPSPEDLTAWAKGEIDRIAKRKEPKVEPNLYCWIKDANDVKTFSNMLLVAHFLTREAE